MTLTFPSIHPKNNSECVRSEPHTAVLSLCQMVSGKGFEVPRRIYVDFDGIALKRKFLMGLEPESIRMTIGETWDGLRSDKGNSV